MATAQAKKEITVPNDVLRGHLHGAQRAAGRVAKAKKSSGGGKKGKAKIKILKPPVDGWK